MTTKIQSLVSKNSNLIVKEDDIMENQKQYPMTQEGYEQLEQELEELKTVKRPEVVEKLKLLVLSVTYQRTLSMMQLKTNKVSSNKISNVLST